MRAFYIMRGIPGAGKSYRVGELRKNLFNYERESLAAFSADDFFMTGGTYRFDPRKLPEAHEMCRRQALDAMWRDTHCIVVENTHIHRWEYISYVYAAKLAEYDVVVIEVMPTTIEELVKCCARCVHGVPHETIARMAVEFETVSERDEEYFDIKVQRLCPTWE